MPPSRVDVVDQGTLARAWAVSPKRFAWLLGAGASAAAGLPTATQIRDDLLLDLYAERHKLLRQNLHPNDPSVRGALEQYFNGRNGMVEFGSEDDYSCAFELALPEESSRRIYLRNLLKGRRPSYGQRVLGALVTAGLVDILATTNFDDLIEQAASESYAAVNDSDNPRVLGVASLNSADRARQILDPSAHPILVKLHGDFAESRLMNLSSELAEQDKVLRQSIHDASRTVGLAVVGYSGRDQSVMAMLDAASEVDGAWPAGIWWFARDPHRTPKRVHELLEKASSHGVATYLVELETFDELMAGLARQATLPTGARSYISDLQPVGRLVEAAVPVVGVNRYPVIRYNALPVLTAPSKALHSPLAGIDYAEFRSRAKEAEWRGIAVMSGGEVWGWGDPKRFAQIAGATPTTVEIDLTGGSLTPGLHAILVEGLTRALCSVIPGHPRNGRRESEVILKEWDDLDEDRLRVLRAFKTAYGGRIEGALPASRGLNRLGEPRAWAEAVRLNVEIRWGAPWMIFSPYTWVERWERPKDKVDDIDPASEWRRERWVQRKKNEVWANLIDTWATSISPGRMPTTLPLPRAADGDSFGGFTLGPTSAYSWRSS